MTSPSLRSERDDTTLVLTVDRPHAKNAIDESLALALEAELVRAEGDTRVSVVVLAATGDVFLSGGDLRALSRLPSNATGAQAVLQLGLHLSAIERCPLPVIAAVQGSTYGGGCELLMMTDLIVMDEHAELSFVHRRMGLVPAWGGTTRLTERVGSARANDLILTARKLGAVEAEQLGVVNRVAARGSALQLAHELARELGRGPREAVMASKRSLVAAREARRGDALLQEQKLFREAWGSPPHLAAMQRFLAR